MQRYEKQNLKSEFLMTASLKYNIIQCYFCIVSMSIEKWPFEYICKNMLYQWKSLTPISLHTHEEIQECKFHTHQCTVT